MKVAGPPDENPDETPDLPMSREAKAAIRKASWTRRAIARFEAVRHLVGDGVLMTRDQHMAILQAIIEDAFVSYHKKDAGHKDKVGYITSIRKLSAQFGKMAGHIEPEGGIDARSYNATFEVGADGRAYRAAESKLEAWRREQAAKIRALDAALPPTPPGADDDDDDDNDDRDILDDDA